MITRGLPRLIFRVFRGTRPWANSALSRTALYAQARGLHPALYRLVASHASLCRPPSLLPYKTCRYFAHVMATAMEPWEAYMAESKRLLFSIHLPKASDARVLELGIGTGPNLKYYPPNGPTILGIDPNPEMLQRAASEARALGVNLEAREGSAMSLPYPDASVDACVCTLVLCSVPDPQKVLQEVRRVLRPGSPLIFIEHVRDPGGWTLRGILQRILNPIQKVFNDGCDIRRDTLAELKASGLFIVDWDPVELPKGQGMDSLDWFLISSQIKGAAYK